MDKWNLIFNRGATYQQTITVAGVSDIADATEWRVNAAFPGAAPFLTATTDNGMIVAGASPSQKILIVPAAVTADFDLGNARFDFEIEWDGGVVRRYVANGFVQVNPAAGG